MNPLNENPFRVLGLFANASEREIQKQIANLSAYTRVGKSPGTDGDLLFLGPPIRSEASIKEAGRQIEQPAGRVHHALFWFIKANHIDEIALSHLKDSQHGGPQKAAEIWEMAVSGKAITSKNLSAALNLSTLQLGFSTSDHSCNPVVLQQAIKLKTAVLASEAFDEVVDAAGRVGVARQDHIAKEFADSVIKICQPFLDEDGGIPTPSLIAALEGLPETIIRGVKQKFTDGPLSRIDDEVESAIGLRVDDPFNAEVTGEDLYENTREDIGLLKKILGEDHPQVQIVVNKVANEILQCSIDYFNELQDHDDIDPGDDTLRLLNFARSLEPTGEVRQRINENAPIIERWIANKSERDKKTQVDSASSFIVARIEEFSSIAPSPKAAKTFLGMCRPKLLIVARLLGENEELYLKISDAVAGNALGMTVEAVNRAQKLTAESRVIDPDALSRLQILVDSAMEVMNELASLDLSADMRNRCSSNGRTLLSIGGDIARMRGRPAPHSTGTTGRPQAKPQVSPNPQFYTGPDFATRVAIFLEKRFWIGVTVLLGAFGLILLAMFNASSSLSNSANSTANSNPATPTGMVYVKGGSYTIGRNVTKLKVEQPSRLVSVRPFYVDIYETTNQEYGEFVRATGHRPPATWNGSTYPSYNAKLPVVGVTYDDATAYARWKNKRLPTEEEWEAAARGDGDALYPWGSNWEPEKANADSTHGYLMNVGTTTGKSTTGTYDMSGNAWEWTSSDFKPYPGGTLPKEYIGKSNLKTMRGGSFSTPRDMATTTYRIGWPATGATNYDQAGFRLAMDAPK
jgi:formylglycine-generating enzyme required for sulfatase activity